MVEQDQGLKRCKMIRFLLVFLLHCHTASSWQQRTITRRDAIMSASGGFAFSGLLLPTEPAKARALGAAELDLEYYMRDFVGGNKQEGNVLPSTPPAVAPPRVIHQPLLGALLTDDFSPTCVPVATLVQAVRQQQQGQQTGSSTKEIERNISATAQIIREKASRSFYTRAPWQNPTVSDQYYFDASAYALWRTAAQFLPNYVDRDVFVRNMGRVLYRQIVADGLIKPTPSPTTKGSIVGTINAVRQVLDAFCQSNYCKEYRLGPDQPVVTDKSSSKKNKQRKDIPLDPVVIVDELDDQALASGASVDFLVSILEPATLGAALQITGEQSRFAPDLVGPTLAALLQDLAGLECTWETFFIDPVYRPNPKDYFPTEQLLQYTLKLS